MQNCNNETLTKTVISVGERPPDQSMWFKSQDFPGSSELEPTTLRFAQTFVAIRLINHIDVSVKTKVGDVWTSDRIKLLSIRCSEQTNVVLHII